MWTLISSIDLRSTRQRLTRFVVAAAVVVGTGTQLAMAFLPQPPAGTTGVHFTAHDSQNDAPPSQASAPALPTA